MSVPLDIVLVIIGGVILFIAWVEIPYRRSAEKIKREFKLLETQIPNYIEMEQAVSAIQFNEITKTEILSSLHYEIYCRTNSLSIGEYILINQAGEYFYLDPGDWIVKHDHSVDTEYTVYTDDEFSRKFKKIQ